LSSQPATTTSPNKTFANTTTAPTANNSQLSSAQFTTLFTEGVYYDAKVGTFVTINAADGDQAAAVLSPVDIQGGDTALTLEKWAEKKEDLYSVPASAVEDPVAFYEEQVEQMLAEWPERPKIGFMYADAMTEVAELQIRE